MDIKKLIETSKIVKDKELQWYRSVFIPIIIKNKQQYFEIERRTGVPAAVVACIHARENGPDVGIFKSYLGNGQPLDRVTTIVPRGRGPWKDWVSGAEDAIKLVGLDKVKDWTEETAVIEWEKYNGLGYKNIGKNSPYVWSFTNHGIKSGKFVSDGKYEPKVSDQNPGCWVLYQLILEKDKTFQISGMKDLDLPKVSWFDGFLQFFKEIFKFVVPETIDNISILIQRNPELSETGIKRALGFLNQARKKDYLIYCDFDQESTKKRLYVIDLDDMSVVAKHKVAHGRNSDPNNSGFATSFSNISGSNKSSLGAMITGKAYGKHDGGWSKFANAVVLHGIELGINDKVKERNVVWHSSTYVDDKTEGRSGRSLGCPAVDHKIAKKLQEFLVDGRLFYIHHKGLK